mgnify:CR=1 FL=1
MKTKKYGNCPREFWSPFDRGRKRPMSAKAGIYKVDRRCKANRRAWINKHPVKCNMCNYRFASEVKCRNHVRRHHYASATEPQNSNRTGKVNPTVSKIGDEVKVTKGKYAQEIGASIHSFSKAGSKKKSVVLKLRDGTITGQIPQKNLQPVFLALSREIFAWLRLRKTLPPEVIFEIQEYVAPKKAVPRKQRADGRRGMHAPFAWEDANYNNHV